jgi:hypothetical protein
MRIEYQATSFRYTSSAKGHIFSLHTPRLSLSNSCGCYDVTVRIYVPHEAGTTTTTTTTTTRVTRLPGTINSLPCIVQQGALSFGTAV